MENSTNKYLYKNTAEKFEWPSLLIATILMVLGVFAIVFSWDSRACNIENLINYISIYNIIAIVAIFFIGVGIYVWYWFIENVLTKPRQAILFLKDLDNNNSFKSILTFIDSKGKKYMFTLRKNKNCKNNWIELNAYYEVLKTNGKIFSIINTSNNSFPIVEKHENFWLNWYTPVGDFKNIFLLPIVYLSFIVLFFAGIETMRFKLWTGIPVGIFVLLNGSIIAYDIYEKIKRYKNTDN